jgi:DNA polymerase/3'-5' exonuclease PolX
MNNLIISKFNILLQLLKESNKYELNKNNKITNMFRIKQLYNAANIIENLDYTITVNNADKLINLPGIGKGTVARIYEILNTKHLEEINYLQQYITTNKTDYFNLKKLIDDLSTIIGIGNETAVKLIKEHDLVSLADFKNKVANNTIKLNNNIKLGLKYLDVYQPNIPRTEIQQIETMLNNIVFNLDPKYIFIICGSYRRGKLISNDIDILLIHENVLEGSGREQDNKYLKIFVDELHRHKFIIDDLTVSTGTKYMGFCRLNEKSIIRRIDIRMVPVISFFPALVYFTGPYEFNQNMRKTAKKQGYKLNEYGLYDLKTNKSLILLNEKMVFDMLNMDYLEPHER